MIRKTREWFNIHLTKNTSAVLLLVIVILNVAFIVASALLISSFRLQGTEQMSFPKAAFCTLTMIMDAGCIQFVIEDIGQAHVATAIACLLIILIGMIIFTGALIGYITNAFSRFIDNINAGRRRLYLSDHIVILNWNTRASEIINDCLYEQDKKHKFVVLVDSKKDEIQKEIRERIADTLSRERKIIRDKAKKFGSVRGMLYRLHNRFRMNVVVIVREGDVFSTMQLKDISLQRAKSVIILGNDLNTSICKFETRERLQEQEKGNVLTVKTLMQVADITSGPESVDKQTIIVEITDEWTQDLVDKIIKVKEKKNKCHIVPIHINRSLGQILSQFSIMPELNSVYSELFSNKNAAFYCKETKCTDEAAFIREHLRTHVRSIPLTIMEIDDRRYAYYVANDEQEILRTDDPCGDSVDCAMNPDFDNGTKTIIILGHNSRTKEILQGFSSFFGEWAGNGTKLNITMIDEQGFLERMNYYREYPFVETFGADIYDKERIGEKIRGIVDETPSDTSILILSDDNVIQDEVDANALTNLIYQQDIIREKVKTIDGFDPTNMDVIVEIVDPKHYDVVSNYSQNNVVISNRYVSKMITQVSEKEPLYMLFRDILTYDTARVGQEQLQSKEIYLKEACSFFTRIPGTCTAAQLIREVYRQSTDPEIFRKQINPTLVLGYVRLIPNPENEKRLREEMTLFTGNQNEISVTLQPHDKLIVYSLH
ncbi:MAG: hypothetical protein IJT41_09765 [Clostridia bacterium]|nr:hypothetical protein [Clostridia bacterium]